MHGHNQRNRASLNLCSMPFYARYRLLMNSPLLAHVIRMCTINCTFYFTRHKITKNPGTTYFPNIAKRICQGSCVVSRDPRFEESCSRSRLLRIRVNVLIQINCVVVNSIPSTRVSSIVTHLINIEQRHRSDEIYIG